MTRTGGRGGGVGYTGPGEGTIRRRLSHSLLGLCVNVTCERKVSERGIRYRPLCYVSNVYIFTGKVHHCGPHNFSGNV